MTQSNQIDTSGYLVFIDFVYVTSDDNPRGITFEDRLKEVQNRYLTPGKWQLFTVVGKTHNWFVSQGLKTGALGARPIYGVIKTPATVGEEDFPSIAELRKRRTDYMARMELASVTLGDYPATIPGPWIADDDANISVGAEVEEIVIASITDLPPKVASLRWGTGCAMAAAISARRSLVAAFSILAPNVPVVSPCPDNLQYLLTPLVLRIRQTLREYYGMYEGETLKAAMSHALSQCRPDKPDTRWVRTSEDWYHNAPGCWPDARDYYLEMRMSFYPAGYTPNNTPYYAVYDWCKRRGAFKAALMTLDEFNEIVKERSTI